MRKKWITKMAAVCLSEAMTVTPTAQGFAAETSTLAEAGSTEVPETSLEMQTTVAEEAQATTEVHTQQEETESSTESTQESAV